jgi:hypothetical protein
MYAYRPTFKKKKEKLLAWFLTALGIILYITARIPGAPVPGILQILGVFCLAGMILLVSMCIMRRYEYVLEQNDDETVDFIITEYYGRRTTVVCRVSLAEVCSVLPLTKETEEQYKALKKQGTHYSYTGLLFDEKRYLVEMQAHGEHIFIRICADETLRGLLEKH